jgi:hypothetical protein
MARGSLTVVGTGIRLDHMTAQAQACLDSADKVLFLAADPLTAGWIAKHHRGAESLHPFYQPTGNRHLIYQQIAERILTFVRQGREVCVAFYGHPGVFVNPAHEAIRRARAEGFSACMLPGISAEDCLFADLGVNPGAAGCQSFEATDFLLYRRKFDTASALILWQVGATGDLSYGKRPRRLGFQVLTEVLRGHYPSTHPAIVYEAAQYPTCDPYVERLTLARLPKASLSPASTLYIPPKSPAPLDRKMARRLGIEVKRTDRRNAGNGRPRRKAAQRAST